MKVIVTLYGRAGRGASSAEPWEKRHGDEVQGGPAVAVAAAWFTLCGGGADVRVRRSSTAMTLGSPVWRRGGTQ